MKNRKGFTLLEILLVVAALAILAGIVILAINPTKQLGDTRDAQRNSDINAILNAVYQWSIDNNGRFPHDDNGTPNNPDDDINYIFDVVADAVTCGDQETEICHEGLGVDATTCVDNATGLVQLTYLDDLTPDYLTALPTDPQDGIAGAGDAEADGSWYHIVTNGRRLTVCAPNNEGADAIEVTR